MLMFLLGFCTAVVLMAVVYLLVIVKYFGSIKAKQQEIENRQKDIAKEIKQGSRMTDHRFDSVSISTKERSNIVPFNTRQDNE